MRRFPAYLLAVLSVMSVLFSCGRKGRVIPESKLTAIYADMLVLDEWIRQNHGENRKADTSLVYEPVFEKYGYTTKDYRASVDHYMKNPDDFAELFQDVEKRLKSRADAVRAIQRAIKNADSLHHYYDTLTFRRLPLLHDYFRELIYSRDTIHFELDSTGAWRLADASPDTLFKGPLLVIKERDSLKIRMQDSLRLAALRLDSLRIDSLKRASVKLDSLRQDSLRIEKEKEVRSTVKPIQPEREKKELKQLPVEKKQVFRRSVDKRGKVL